MVAKQCSAMILLAHSLLLIPAFEVFVDFAAALGLAERCVDTVQRAPDGREAFVHFTVETVDWKLHFIYFESFAF